MKKPNICHVCKIKCNIIKKEYIPKNHIMIIFECPNCKDRNGLLKKQKQK